MVHVAGRAMQCQTCCYLVVPLEQLPLAWPPGRHGKLHLQQLTPGLELLVTCLLSSPLRR